MTKTKATESEIQKALAELGNWTVESGKLHREYGFRGIITKPYKIEELGRILSEVITETPRSSP